MGKSKLSDEEIRKRAYGKDPDSLSEKLRKNAAKIVMAVITIAMISTMILGYAATFMQGTRHSEQSQGIQVQVDDNGNLIDASTGEIIDLQTELSSVPDDTGSAEDAVQPESVSASASDPSSAATSASAMSSTSESSSGSVQASDPASASATEASGSASSSESE
jgi:hypothetical protein